MPRPMPILIRFFSRIFSDSLASLHNAKPNPHVYKKNKMTDKTILNLTIKEADYRVSLFDIDKEKQDAD